MRFQSACWSSVTYSAMIDIRGYVMLIEFVLDQERAQSFVMGISGSSLHAGEVLEQERIVQR